MRYLLALDADTEPLMNTVSELVGVCAAPAQSAGFTEKKADG